MPAAPNSDRRLTVPPAAWTRRSRSSPVSSCRCSRARVRRRPRRARWALASVWTCDLSPGFSADSADSRRAHTYLPPKGRGQRGRLPPTLPRFDPPATGPHPPFGSLKVSCSRPMTWAGAPGGAPRSAPADRASSDNEGVGSLMARVLVVDDAALMRRVREEVGVFRAGSVRPSSHA